MTGIPFPPITERLQMLDEALTCIESLWANERTTFDGEIYKLKDAILWPKPIKKPHPPILVAFVREEAKRNGRCPDAVKISSMVFRWMLTDSREATRRTAEMMAPVFGFTPDGLLQSPMALVGTPEDCIVELKRRIKSWGLSQIIFSNAGTPMDEATFRRLWEKVLVHV